MFSIFFSCKGNSWGLQPSQRPAFYAYAPPQITEHKNYGKTSFHVADRDACPAVQDHIFTYLAKAPYRYVSA